jgi:hypothetical protein
VTQDDYELRKASHMFGWRWGVEGAQHMCDGQGLKDPCYFVTFFRITKEKLLFEAEIGFIDKIIPKGGLDIFLFFDN